MRTLVLALVALSASSCIDRRDYAVGADAGEPDAPIEGGTITVTIEGRGRVASDRRGIDCPDDCVATYPPDGFITLTPVPDSGAEFKEWRGACEGDGPCVLLTGETHDVLAVFTGPSVAWRLGVTLAGTGAGAVTSTPAGITCGGVCQAHFAEGTQVTLTPTITAGSVFTGWCGACSGVGACVVTMTMEREVTATFVPAVLRNLQVLMSGSGSGNVRSTPVGVDCTSGTCNAAFPEGSTVQLVATAVMGSAFRDWGGACAGNASVCSVVMSDARTVIANFTTVATLTVVRTGAGTGTVISLPAGIACGTDCSETYAVGAGVTLSAMPAAGSRFVQWSGACGSAADACSLTLIGDTVLVAEFALL